MLKNGQKFTDEWPYRKKQTDLKVARDTSPYL
jgi:uncharacterized membrane protein YfbV (UPF0208 family)